ncbi:MAG TPA: helix-turn-helix domain-containing protein [Rubrobacteraceae bacterium]|nr:helix-turn-helix domain-containing protein [Rubrobacteraceae bacterium]
MMPPDERSSASSGGDAPGRQLMRRDERRGQILAAAKRAFLRSGFAATGLEDVASHAEITKVLIYRHFDSKADLYRAALNDTRARVRSATGGADRLGEESFGALVAVADEDPDGFRLLYRHAVREPEFRAYAQEFRDRAATVAERYLRELVPDAGRRQWAARLVPVLTLETIMSWLDAGRPAPEEEVAVAVNGSIDGFLAAVAAE